MQAYYDFFIILYNTINLLAILFTFFAIRKGNKVLFPVYLFLVTDIISFSLKILSIKLTDYGLTKEEVERIKVLVDYFVDPVRYGFVAWFFYLIIKLQEFRKFIIFSIVFTALFSLVNALFFQLEGRPTYLYSVVSLLQIILAMMYLVQVLEAPPENRLAANPFFLISLAFLFVSIFSFFSFLLEPYLWKSNNSIYFETFFYLLTFALLGFYTLITIASAQSLKTRL